MYLNTFLITFGLNPDNFKNKLVEPIITEDKTFLYNLEQRTDIRICPECGCVEANINDYYYTETRSTNNEGLPTIIRIKKARFKCKTCSKTFVMGIDGIDHYSKISNQIKQLIKNEFKKQKSFSIIAKDYKLSTTEVIRLFDESFPEIQRGYLPEALCIDEIGFKTYDGSYAAIIYDHDKKVVTDVIRNRQTEYLRTYFYKYSFKERMRVKYFVSDLYEGYVAIKEEFFNTAIHVVDLFHVIRLLRVEVSRLRVRTYKDFTTEEDIERNFMKNHWQYFEMRMTHKIMYKTYYSKKHKREYTIWQMMRKCLSLNPLFWEAYQCLQDLFGYHKCRTFDEAIMFIERISNLLKNTLNDDLVRVGKTYYKWRNEIANAITCKNIDGKRFSNGPAEGLNNAIKTIIKDANGYKDFERFRKRTLVILRDNKSPSR